MRVITAVLRDLYTFVFVYHFGLRRINADTPERVDEAHSDAAMRTPRDVSNDAAQRPTPSGILPEVPCVPQLTSGTRLTGIGYAYSPDTYLYALPTRTFDGVIRRLAYGDSFQILGTQGKWCNVAHDETRGWIHRDDVTENGIRLKPQFVAGEVYDAEHPTTVKLRTFIDDAFHAAQLDVPLQDVEYVTYVLAEKHKKIPWGNERPRIAGTWQRLLRGIRGVHIGVHPRSGSIMEYMLPNGTGHVAYVDSVYPDGGITISEIGPSVEGVYAERTLDQAEWKELRPVFIEIL